MSIEHWGSRRERLCPDPTAGLPSGGIIRPVVDSRPPESLRPEARSSRETRRAIPHPADGAISQAAGSTRPHPVSLRLHPVDGGGRGSLAAGEGEFAQVGGGEVDVRLRTFILE